MSHWSLRLDSLLWPCPGLLLLHGLLQFFSPDPQRCMLSSMPLFPCFAQRPRRGPCIHNVKAANLCITYIFTTAQDLVLNCLEIFKSEISLQEDCSPSTWNAYSSMNTGTHCKLQSLSLEPSLCDLASLAWTGINASHELPQSLSGKKMLGTCAHKSNIFLCV